MDSIQLKNRLLLSVWVVGNYYSIPSSYEVHKRKKKSKNKDGIDPSLLNRGKNATLIKCTMFLRLRIFHYKSVEAEKDRN